MIFHDIYDLSDNNIYNLQEELQQINVSAEVIDYLASKFTYKRYYIKNLDYRAANILKQEALSIGLDAAISYKTYTMNPEKTDVLLSGNIIQLQKLSEKLKKQPFKLKELGNDISFLVNSNDFEDLNVGKVTLKKGSGVKIMGVINLTPDSFFCGSRVDFKSLENKIKEMVDAKVDIIDIGGESTRPNSEPVSEDEEIKRVIPAIEIIKKMTDTPVSIDTYKAKVAELAINKGVDLINDISALTMDKNMIKVVKESKKPVVLMHMKGTPKNMQQSPIYENVIDEVFHFFKSRIEFCKDNGINENKIIIDPGIGFGKRYKDNLILTKFLGAFKTLKKPILYAASRKSFIGMALGEDNNPIPAEQRLFGSLAVHLVASSVASIIRVHDVKETWQMERIRKEVDGVSRFEHTTRNN